MAGYFDKLVPSGDPVIDVQRFLAPRRPETWRHIRAVARVATDLAERFGADLDAARIAAHGHDLAAVVPKPHLVREAERWGILLSAEDRAIPEVLHGPIAAMVLRERLHVLDPGILDAVRYHTTLRPHASALDKIVFVADKIAFDPTTPRTGYLEAMEKGLSESLDSAAFAYIEFVVANRQALGWRLHPDLLGAYEDLRETLGTRVDTR